MPQDNIIILLMKSFGFGQPKTITQDDLKDSCYKAYPASDQGRESNWRRNDVERTSPTGSWAQSCLGKL